MEQKEWKDPEVLKQDLVKLYDRFWEPDSNGARAELRRVTQPGDLLEIPAFYRLVRDLGSQRPIQRAVFCLPFLKHKEGGKTLGQALATTDIHERRLLMVVRAIEPNDLIQLRRLLKQKEPVVDVGEALQQIFYWNQRARQKLLEDFFFHQKEKA